MAAFLSRSSVGSTLVHDVGFPVMANNIDSSRQQTSELSEERSPGIMSGGLIGRIIAVTLFVGLCTFAVALSLNGTGHDGEHAHLSTETPDVENDVDTFKPPVVTSNSGFIAPPAKKKPSLGGGSFGGTSFAGPPKSESFGGKPPAIKSNIKSASFPVKKQPFKKDPFPPAAPVKKPLVAAQKASFGGLGKPPSMSFGDKNVNLKPIARQNGVGQTAKNLTDSVSNQFQNAREKATGALGNAKNAAANGLRNFGDQASKLLPTGQKNDPNGFAAKPPANPKSIPNNFLPTTQGPPPAKPSAAFDGSRKLQPIGNGSNAKQPAPPKVGFGNQRFAGTQQPRNPNPSSPTLPTLKGRSNQTPNALGTPKRPFNAQPKAQPKAQPRTQQNFGGSNVANRNGPPVNRVAAATLLTKPTPGEKQLDGVQAPSVTIEKIAPREIQLNQPVECVLIVKNIGRVAANNVRVFDEIPAGTQMLEATPQPNRGNGSHVDWNLGTLQPGQEKRIKVKLKPTRPGEIGSVAQVTFAAQASMRTRVTKPEISIFHKSAPKVLIGDRVAIDIVVKNDGDGPANNVMIQEDLPPQLLFSEGYRELEYAIGTLAPGQSKNVNLVLKAAEIGPFRNTMVAHADGGLQDQHSIDMEVIAPKLQLSADGPVRRFLNRETKHKFSIQNIGTAKATNVDLVCRLPAGLKYVSTNNQGKYDPSSHAVFWELAELGENLTASVELVTSPIEPGNQDLKFEAAADLDQTAALTRPLAVQHLVDVFFDIDDVVDPIEIGADTSYKIRVVNQGTKTAANVILQVNFPNGINPTSVDGNVANEIRGNQIAFSPITSMNPGDEISITITATGQAAGDHKVVVNLTADGRQANVAKQETTHVYSDR